MMELNSIKKNIENESTILSKQLVTLEEQKKNFGGEGCEI